MVNCILRKKKVVCTSTCFEEDVVKACIHIGWMMLSVTSIRKKDSIVCGFVVESVEMCKNKYRLSKCLGLLNLNMLFL